MAKPYRIYMDVCCLNRPFDDSLQDRIRLETEAVLSIYRKCRIGEWQLISSEVIDLEIAQTKNIQRLELIYKVNLKLRNHWYGLIPPSPPSQGGNSTPMLKSPLARGI